MLKQAKDILLKILANFKSKEKKIGEELLSAHRETQQQMTTIGKCQKCKDGKLVIKKGKFGRFIACDKYPDCKSTHKLPAGGLVKPTEESCEHCKHPMINIIRKGKKPQKLCINTDCSSKKLDAAENKQLVKDEGKKCPNCGKGTLVERKSVYGTFLGCSNYPKCKFIEGNGKGKKK